MQPPEWNIFGKTPTSLQKKLASKRNNYKVSLYHILFLIFSILFYFLNLIVCAVCFDMRKESTTHNELHHQLSRQKQMIMKKV